ncbi:Phosphoesterase [Penicillium expansum]|uniref:acid phosphatase n=1 Tax=Penicillium expansum TaxID=27334 RepID=A0A0A2IWB6_PENEN|nr:Phosphoesterase [Penicillium expansum]KGO43953.1 Phosphoesterase [Penicillium expansum]KGO44450.1 Phosphoesterase [Penicillium expansum]KGO60976.1 Phosphoesterase [Penicillium expansum]
MKAVIAVVMGAAALATAQTATTSEPAVADIRAAAATTKPEVTTSDVKGLAFDRFYQVWLENIDYSNAASDANMQWLASQGILLNNFYAVTHPSEPNYCAAAGGDTFGMDNDDFNQIPGNVSTIADLLDTKSVSWGEYQEHIPYAGFQGYNYSNQETYANDYVRKHNPLVLYDSVVTNNTRARHIKSFDDFEDDLQNKKLPQWAFITPNMTNDAHDTNITFAAKWERSWVSKLLDNEYFMNNTLLLLTFDEDKTYTNDNRIFSILVGGAVPQHLKGTKDDTFYTHYSSIASVSANWGLPSLGRWDCGANLFEIVANKTGYVNYEVDKTYLTLNQTYPGPMSIGDPTIGNTSTFIAEWPVPITDSNEKCSAGHGILDIVKKTYGHLNSTYDTKPYPWEAKTHYNDKVTATRASNATTSKTNSTAVSSSSTSTGVSGAGVSATAPMTTVVLGALLAVAAYSL